MLTQGRDELPMLLHPATRLDWSIRRLPHTCCRSSESIARLFRKWSKFTQPSKRISDVERSRSPHIASGQRGNPFDVGESASCGALGCCRYFAPMFQLMMEIGNPAATDSSAPGKRRLDYHRYTSADPTGEMP